MKPDIFCSKYKSLKKKTYTLSLKKPHQNVFL